MLTEMAMLLGMLPLGSPWFHWDDKKTGEALVEALAQDGSNIIFVGEDGWSVELLNLFLFFGY